VSDAAFAGFEHGLYDFLEDLTINNERTWFKANQARYEAEAREPARAFVRAMSPRLERVTPHLVADDRKMGGSLMRIFRDTRFSKDKSPYKTNVGIQFRHRAGKDVHAPGFYLHLSPDECFVGLGMWRPDGPTLKAIRTALVERPDQWTALLKDPAFNSTWRRSSEDSLKRAPRGFAADHPLVDDLKLKSHILIHDLDHDETLGADLPARLESMLEAGLPHARFLCAAVGLPF
jgi:uncharacterized protein (TIGR02453 family)